MSVCSTSTVEMFLGRSIRALGAFTRVGSREDTPPGTETKECDVSTTTTHRFTAIAGLSAAIGGGIYAGVQELARRGHPFARYADDAKVYVRSERAGQRA